MSPSDTGGPAMELTELHWRFLEQRHSTGVPGQGEGQTCRVTVHALINLNDQEADRQYAVAEATIRLLRNSRHYTDYRTALLSLAIDPGTVNPARRRAFCIKWLARLDQ